MYAVAAVRDLPSYIHEKIECREWSLRTLEGVNRFRELHAKSLPSIAVNGKIVFECVIPPAEELIALIEAQEAAD